MTNRIVIVGAGIVGLATALALSERRPGLHLTVVEKEDRPGRHQSGRNSGVIHSGLYYRPGSLKARLCVQGAEAMVEFCDRHGVPYRRSGKVVVATEAAELPALDELERRAEANGVPGVRRVEPASLREREPHVAGIAGLLVPSTGVVDFGEVTATMASLLVERGADLRLDTELLGAERRARWRLRTTAGDLEADVVVNCAGLYADRIASTLGGNPTVRIIPFRGEYYDVVHHRRSLVSSLIYPVPDPRFPFLGVHLTRDVHGHVDVGPNAVPATAREGYDRRSVSWADMRDVLGFPGSWRLAGRYWRTGATEMYRSLSKEAFVRSARRLVPDLRADDLVAGTSGVRAQAVDRTGRLVDDFEIVEDTGAVHVLNAPSPAATSSLLIGRSIADLVSVVE